MKVNVSKFTCLPNFMTNSVPAVERAMDLIAAVGRRPGGITVADLLLECQVPKATLYRLLHTLKSNGYLAEMPLKNGHFALGPEFRRLAGIAPGSGELLDTARPLLNQLSEEIGETVKLVVRELTEAVTIFVANPSIEFRITAKVGTRLPLYVGGSQRLLLAYAPAHIQDEVLRAPLDKRATRTMTDPAQIRSGFEQIRQANRLWTHSEGAEGVGSFSAGIARTSGPVEAAVVAVYIHAGKTAEQRQTLEAAVLRCAARIGVGLG